MTTEIENDYYFQCFFYQKIASSFYSSFSSQSYNEKVIKKLAFLYKLYNSNSIDQEKIKMGKMI